MSQVFNNNPKGSRLGKDQDTDGGIVYKQILINEKLQVGKRGKKTELTDISPLRIRRSVLNCSDIEEEEGGEEEEEEEEGGEEEEEKKEGGMGLRSARSE